MAFALDYLGRAHPLLIHAPITLLLLGGFIELCRIRRESAFLAESAVWVFGLGTVAAAVAAISGWLLAKHGHHDPDQRYFIELHRWLALATAVVSLFAWFSEVAWARTGRFGPIWTRRVLAWSTSLLTIAAGNFGAVIVWGADWFS